MRKIAMLVGAVALFGSSVSFAARAVKPAKLGTLASRAEADIAKTEMGFAIGGAKLIGPLSVGGEQRVAVTSAKGPGEWIVSFKNNKIVGKPEYQASDINPLVATPSTVGAAAPATAAKSGVKTTTLFSRAEADIAKTEMGFAIGGATLVGPLTAGGEQRVAVTAKNGPGEWIVTFNAKGKVVGKPEYQASNVNPL